jgi:hypothetical protein
MVDVKMSKDPKVYEFNNVNDFIIYLSLLIELTIKHYRRFNSYFKELEKYTFKKFNEITEVSFEEIKEIGIESLLEKNEIYLKNKDKVELKYVDYKNIEDKLFTPKKLLLNAFADRTSNGVSYWKFRKEIEKKSKNNKEFDFGLQEFDENMRYIINELSSARNYEHHFTDAKFIEWRQYREQQINDSLKQGFYNKWPSENIEIYVYEFLDIELLWQLYFTSKESNESFSQLLQQMKKDYSKLIGKQMSVYYKKIRKQSPTSVLEISINGINRHKGNK